jgi:hypothetical protein
LTDKLDKVVGERLIALTEELEAKMKDRMDKAIREKMDGLSNKMDANVKESIMRAMENKMEEILDAESQKKTVAKDLTQQRKEKGGYDSLTMLVDDSQLLGKMDTCASPCFVCIYFLCLLAYMYSCCLLLVPHNRFIMDKHQIGVCFLGPDCEEEIAEDFMTFIRIADVNFREVCRPEILKMLWKEFKKMNGKIVSTYRKNLTDCKLLLTGTMFLFLTAASTTIVFPACLSSPRLPQGDAKNGNGE